MNTLLKINLNELAYGIFFSASFFPKSPDTLIGVRLFCFVFLISDVFIAKKKTDSWNDCNTFK